MAAILLGVLYYVLLVFWLLLLGRLVVELVRTFAREWRPTGVAVVIIETVFTLTDPPIKALRRILPPIPLGPIRLDLSLMIVMLVVIIAMNVVNGLRADAVAESLAAALVLTRS
ncbi:MULTISPECIES: YggT family protein [Gordonia]|uniref:YggT family protein n=1 Tax=Gordonia amicalis TaxID=89053 RepID=A0AAE4R4Y7_9ACTN|nr:MULTISPECIES: YggT family protein [Gordonia]ATD71402.1 YggT family protein [Gordonia sp. 1D]MBA5849569.1 YggT family protein [Gordonia amicalis]MCR8896391.1 YggT family protein [Gordonia sp. GONU]MCZ4580187.1 YggT family protein [Gordonia amicalis]MCZ4650270.1 YggT family protein [Gordonia amicalis]